MGLSIVSMKLDYYVIILIAAEQSTCSWGQGQVQKFINIIAHEKNTHCVKDERLCDVLIRFSSIDVSICYWLPGRDELIFLIVFVLKNMVLTVTLRQRTFKTAACYMYIIGILRLICFMKTKWFWVKRNKV